MKKLVTPSFNKLVIILIVLIISILQSCGETKRKTRQEPYNVIEQQDITLTYLVEDHQIYRLRTAGVPFVTKPKMKVYCTVTNTSEYGGIFKLYATMSSQGSKLEFNDEQYLPAGQTKEFSEEFEINDYSFETGVKIDDWGIIAPTISVDKEVTKYRTVEYD